MRKPRFRFNLFSLLLLTTAVCCFFGYAQWRRNRLLQQAEDLWQRGGYIQLPDDAIDHVWQRIPTKAVIVCKQNSPESDAFLKDKMSQMGIREIGDPPQQENWQELKQSLLEE